MAGILAAVGQGASTVGSAVVTAATTSAIWIKGTAIASWGIAKSVAVAAAGVFATAASWTFGAVKGAAVGLSAAAVAHPFVSGVIAGVVGLTALIALVAKFGAEAPQSHA